MVGNSSHPLLPEDSLYIHRTQMFAPAQYQATVPLVLQPLMPGPVPPFNQDSGPPRTPMLANVRQAGNGIAQGSVAAPTASLEMSN